MRLLAQSLGLGALVLLAFSPAGMAAPSPVERQADLVVRSLSGLPRVQAPGERFVVVDRVQNTGRRVDSTFAMGYFLSKDRGFGRNDVLAGGRVVRKLGSGGSSRGTTRIAVPRRIATGRYFLIACADRLQGVSERSERNNCRASQRRISVEPRPAPPILDRRPSGMTNSTTARIGFTTGDRRSASGFRCRLGQLAFAKCTSPVEYDGLGEGLYTFEVKALDRFGRESAASRFTWKVDLTPPSMPTLVARPADPSNAANPGFSLGGLEPGARIECTLDWGVVEICSSSPAFSGLSEGRHVFAVRLRDAANNESPFQTYGWTIDLTAPPTPSLTAVPREIDTSENATLAFSSSEGGVAFRCQLDGASFVPCSTPHSYTGLGDGMHTFAVSTRDAAGNESVARTFAWRVDLLPPTMTFTTRPAHATRVQQAGFAFSPSEPVRWFRCRLDAGSFTACSSPQTYSHSLAEGQHTFTVTAEDLVGRIGSSTYTWLVDLTPPSRPSLVSFPENPTNATGATFSVTSSEAGLSYRCKLDAAPFASCSNPQTYAGLGQGAHKLEMMALDAAGNESAVQVHRWMVDTTASPAPHLRLGVFRFGGPAAVRGFETWLNRPVTRVLDYIPGDSWVNLAQPDWVVSKWQYSGYKPVYSTPLLAGPGSNLAEGAYGTYDAHFRSLAQTLVAYGQGDAVIRLGWEFNGGWFPWAAKGKTADFITFWRRVVNVMRAVSPAFKFDWNPAYGPLEFPADQAYPGDAYVDYIGLVVFDQGWEPGYNNDVLRWRNLMNLPFAMQWHQDFAAAHGKKMTYPEWALTWRDDYPGHGGGDNPFFIEKMYQWLNSNQVEYALYFEDDKAGSTRHALMAGHFPAAAARFKQLLGPP